MGAILSHAGQHRIVYIERNIEYFKKVYHSCTKFRHFNKSKVLIYIKVLIYNKEYYLATFVSKTNTKRFGNLKSFVEVNFGELELFGENKLCHYIFIQ